MQTSHSHPHFLTFPVYHPPTLSDIPVCFVLWPAEFNQGFLCELSIGIWWAQQPTHGEDSYSPSPRIYPQPKARQWGVVPPWVPLPPMTDRASLVQASVQVTAPSALLPGIVSAPWMYPLKCIKPWRLVWSLESEQRKWRHREVGGQSTCSLRRVKFEGRQSSPDTAHCPTCLQPTTIRFLKFIYLLSIW